MTKTESDNSKSLHKACSQICDQVELLVAAGVDQDSQECLQMIGEELSVFASHAIEALRVDLARGTEYLSRLTNLAKCWLEQFPEESEFVQQLTEYICQSLNLLMTVAGQDSDKQQQIESLIADAQHQWQDYMDVIDGSIQDVLDDGVRDSDEEEEIDWTGDDSASLEIEKLLNAVADSEFELQNGDTSESGFDPSPRVATDEHQMDPEMLEAYLDDAIRCLNSMEQSALAIEDSVEQHENVQQFCRELHTLKGASATVGLNSLAGYLHSLESSLEASFEGSNESISAEPMFAAVDRVRAEIESLSCPDSESSQCESENVLDPTKSQADKSISNSNRNGFSAGDGTSVRIRASQLDRLMDMLADLVVLRNRRESHVSEFNGLNEELSRCSSRLSLAEEQLGFDLDEISFTDSSTICLKNTSSATFSEVAKDISALSQELRALQKPVSTDNLAISRFICDFRHELMRLRRVPVSGLLHRLQRAARDAAKTEEKEILIKLVGEQTGLEQEVQERLFDPLLHIVRNSVSHGIESELQREKCGKPKKGTVTISAFSNAQLLIIEVNDDGNGLDYSAIKTRAISQGIISPQQNLSQNELSKLIFHPGFSTRESANEISGRGVGMDVVATALNKLKGRIDVESEAGQGTTIRLRIPLRTGIEHVMVFRSGGQLFGLPMQLVSVARASQSDSIRAFSFASLLKGNISKDQASEDVLQIRQPSQSNEELPWAFGVDRLVGPEEVVVRKLPGLLAAHPLFCGISLSGSGETVILLDSEQLAEFCQRQIQQNDLGTVGEPEKQDGKSTNSATENALPRALVIDDSLTARKSLVKILQQHDFATVEVSDGLEAIERLNRDQFDLVFTDLDMPRMGGMELLTELQNLRGFVTPVVVVSSRDEASFGLKAIELGAAGYIAKPVSKKAVMDMLSSIEISAQP